MRLVPYVFRVARTLQRKSAPADMERGARMKTVPLKKKRVPRKRKSGVREKSLLERLAEDTTWYVLSEGTRAAIERNAADFHRALLADPTYREEIRRMT